MSAAHPGAASVAAPRYLGRTTVTRWPRRTSARGSALETSASPPVLPNGRISDVTNRMSSTSPFGVLTVREVRGVLGVRLVLLVLLGASVFFPMRLNQLLSHETIGDHAEFTAGADGARDRGARG